MMSFRCVWVLLGVAYTASAVELTGLRTSQAELQRTLRERDDCLRWYSFGGVPEGLTFYPGPEKDVLKETMGSLEGQKATRIFHGMMKGPVLDIPETGFSLCCWLKVNALEKVDRQGYKRSTGGVMASGSGYYNGWRLLVSPQTQTVSFCLGRPEGSRSVTSVGFLTEGEWHHVAVTWDLVNLSLWIDGEVRAATTTAMTYQPAVTHSYFRVGECSEGVGVLDFEIADLGFFSTALESEQLEGLGNPDAVLARRTTEFLSDIPPPPRGGLFRDMRERRYRERFRPLIELEGGEGSPSFQQARSYAQLCVARSLSHSGMSAEAEAAYRDLAQDETAMLLHRARAMLALGDMCRDRRDYSGARREYAAMRDFFVAKHEAFRIEAMSRLRDIETLDDGEPFRDERQRRIDRINAAVPWFHVSPDGDDTNPGTAEAPFRTLERARDALRERRTQEPLPLGGVAVVLHGGVYPRLERSFALTAEDSGTFDAPIVYRAAEGEYPVLRGGMEITQFSPLEDNPVSRRIPVKARKHVVQTDLLQAGVCDLMFGELLPRGRGVGKLAGMDEPAHLELFIDGTPMPLARYPNDTPKMSEHFLHVELGPMEGVRNSGRTIVEDCDVFYYSNERQDAWAKEPDPWLFGYWQRAYFSSYRKALRIDPEKNQIQIDWNLPPKGGRRAEMVLGSGYQGINLLCELDSPGEWYLDRDTGILYLWPPSSLRKAEVLVSCMEAPIVTAENASNIVFRGLTLEAGRQHGVVIKEGDGIILAGCTVRDMGCKGIQIEEGHNHTVIGCDIEHLGDAGIKLTGGDLATLTPSGHVVENCHIHHFAHWDRGAYQPGIEVEGVGSRFSHCLIHDAPHQAFLLSGNDHITEYCEIHDVTHEAGDAGAWYMYGGGGRAISERGNVVRYNYWHHLPYNETFKKYHCVTHMGVYIDNVNGGVTVYGNVFSRFDGPSGAVFFGGSDDIVENNIFCRCFTGIQLSDRSWVYGKAYKSIDAFNAKMKVTEPPWSIRYPRLSTIKPETEDLTLIVRGNVVARNIGVDCDKFIFGNATTMRYARIERNWEDGDPGFSDPDDGDFRIRRKSPVFATCFFEPLPLEKMGLYNDELRASWPVRHPSGNYETLYIDSSIPTKANRKPKDKLPVCRALTREAEILIDGTLNPDEWGDLDPAKGIEIARTPMDVPSKAPASRMWLRRDAENLYLAFRHDLGPGQNPEPKKDTESWWGGADMAEIIFEGEGGDWWPNDKGHGPIFYLLGDCAGQFESYVIAGLPKARADGLKSAVQYAATAGTGYWTAEWRIPLAALSLDPKTSEGCCFNVGVHKPRTVDLNAEGNDKWAVWVGAKGANWKVWNAGRLDLTVK